MRSMAERNRITSQQQKLSKIPHVHDDRSQELEGVRLVSPRRQQLLEDPQHPVQVTPLHHGDRILLQVCLRLIHTATNSNTISTPARLLKSPVLRRSTDLSFGADNRERVALVTR